MKNSAIGLLLGAGILCLLISGNLFSQPVVAGDNSNNSTNNKLTAIPHYANSTLPNPDTRDSVAMYLTNLSSNDSSIAEQDIENQPSIATTLFQDGYSNGGWAHAGNQITVNSLVFPKIVKFNNVVGGGGVDQERVVKKLPTALPGTGWIADFDYKFTTSNIPSELIFDLTSTSADPEVFSTANRIMVIHGPGADNLFISTDGGVDTSLIPISPNTQYYVRLERNSTQLELFVFSDSARTMNVSGSPVTLNISSTDYNGNLKFIQHEGCTVCGPSRTLTAQIDNTKIYDPTTSRIIFQTGYSSPAWTQVGSETTVNDVNFPGIVKFNNNAGGGGVDQERVVKKLPSTLPQSWILQFDYKFTQSSIPSHRIVALTGSPDDPQLNPHLLDIIHGIGSDQLIIEGTTGYSSGIPISQNTKYYVTLENNSTQIKLSVFSDAARTISVGSPVTLNISPSDYFQNLKFIQHDGSLLAGPARTLTAEIDNMKIFTP